jgi:hypothetical protein
MTRELIETITECAIALMFTAGTVYWAFFKRTA